MGILNITVNRHWSAESVRQTCIRHELYTRGDNEDYSRMLSRVERLYPNTASLYAVAEDIYEHSVDRTITDVMYVLEKYAVTTTFEIDNQDDI